MSQQFGVLCILVIQNLHSESVCECLLMFLNTLLNSLAQSSYYLCSENGARVGYNYPFFTEVGFLQQLFHVKIKLNFTGVCCHIKMGSS